MPATIDVKPGHSLTLTRRLQAAPERVWHAWTDPQALRRWFGPSDELTMLVAEADVRVGGRFRIAMKALDGEVHDARGVYREVVRNKKLVFTWAWHSTPEQESLVTVRLEPDGTGTRLTLSHEQFADAAVRDRHQEGWGGCLDKLERFLA